MWMTISVKLDICVSAVQCILLNLTIDLINSLGSLHISTCTIHAGYTTGNYYPWSCFSNCSMGFLLLLWATQGDRTNSFIVSFHSDARFILKGSFIKANINSSVFLSLFHIKWRLLKVMEQWLVFYKQGCSDYELHKHSGIRYVFLKWSLTDIRQHSDVKMFKILQFCQ